MKSRDSARRAGASNTHGECEFELAYYGDGALLHPLLQAHILSFSSEVSKFVPKLLFIHETFEILAGLCLWKHTTAMLHRPDQQQSACQSKEQKVFPLLDPQFSTKCVKLTD